MKISKFKLVFKWLFGGFGAVADYLLDVLNNCLKSIKSEDRDRIQATLNTAHQALATIEQWRWLCPTKWQTALERTIFAIREVIVALGDFCITMDEIKTVKYRFDLAVDAWKEPDDETCVSVDDLIDANLADN